MAKPIKETPILRGKDRENFLRIREENKGKKIDPETKKRMVENYNKVSGKS